MTLREMYDQYLFALEVLSKQQRPQQAPPDKNPFGGKSFN